MKLMHEHYWQNREDEMRWYHYIIGMVIFGAIPFADAIADGILWLVGAK